MGSSPQKSLLDPQLELAKAIAYEIQNGQASIAQTSADLSFLISGKTIYFSVYRRKPYEPDSSVLRLIQGIYELDPAHARKILRNRIYSTAIPTELCLGAVQVSAKRMTWGLSPEKGTSAFHENWNWISVGNPPLLHPSEPSLLACDGKQEALGFRAPLSPSDTMALAHQLAKEEPQKGPLYLRDRQVAALLISKEGELLSWARNTNASNRTQHAELNLLLHYFQKTGQPIPPGSQIYVTLKPCKMCAGAIWVYSENPDSLKVYFSEFDHGRNARSTVLDPGSAERKRVSHTASQVMRVIQSQITL